MKKFSYILPTCLLAITFQASLTSCRGKGAAKAYEMIEKFASKSGKAAKYSDDVARAVNKLSEISTESAIMPVTYECPSCAGYGQVNFIDENGEYLYTGTCPTCDGKGVTTKYETK